MDRVSGVVKDNSAVGLPSHTAAVLLTEPVVVEEEEGGWWRVDTGPHLIYKCLSI